MTSRVALVLGIALLIGAQALASFVLAPMRGALTPHKDVYAALAPGEFAGTLMLGGFRGLACDLLWMRANTAKDRGRYYESIALGKAIVQIQPRFEQIWEYLAWDMAYNIAAEVEDSAGKWSWFLAGLDIDLTGIERNPQSERLVRHLAWMFHHKGDTFRDEIERTDFAPRIIPLIARINRDLPPERQLPLPPAGAGWSNFRYSELCYRATVRVAELNRLRLPPYVRRMIPIGIERDGNHLRNRGQHLAALRRYLASLAEWDRALAWSTAPEQVGDVDFDVDMNREMCEHNIGRLVRKIELLAERLADDPAHAGRLAKAVQQRDWDGVTRELDAGGWKTATAGGRIRWLDE
jgi:hypothetical protein